MLKRLIPARVRAVLAGCLRLPYARRHAVPRLPRLPEVSPAELCELLSAEHLPVERAAIDAAALEAFRRGWDYSGYHYGTPADRGERLRVYHEKSLEHFLSVELTGLSASDTLIDAASSFSNFAENAEKILGCRSFSQDLVFPAGIHGKRIGGDAAAMPVSDGSASVLTLHCSFEHFEGDGDIRFIAEAGRVLGPGGRLCIIPLYVAGSHAVLTDPACFTAKAPLDPGAKWVFSRIGNRFARLYSPAALRARLAEGLSRFFEWRILWFENRPRLFPGLWCNFALLGVRRIR